MTTVKELTYQDVLDEVLEQKLTAKTLNQKIDELLDLGEFEKASMYAEVYNKRYSKR